MKRRGTLTVILLVLLVGQAFLNASVIFPEWKKTYAPKGVADAKGLDPAYFAFALGGFREFIAGLLWVRADKFFEQGNYDAVLPIVRIVTLLDPHQIDVYATGMWHIGYNFTDTEQRSDRRYLPVALAFGAEGARVAVTYHQHEPDDALRAACPGLVALPNQATDEADTKAVVAQVVEALGGIDVLVNNVGGMVRRTPISEMTYAHWREVMELNLDSMFLMTKAVMPHLADGGRIINVASVAGHNGGGDGAVAYATAKSGMFAFTRGLAKELAGRRPRATSTRQS